MLGIGMKRYDRLAGKSVLPKSELLSNMQVRSFIPPLKTENLLGGFRYYDVQMGGRQLANSPTRQPHGPLLSKPLPEFGPSSNRPATQARLADYAFQRNGRLLTVFGGKWTTSLALAEKLKRKVH
jgi:glycerol-3-phosphate dehydrogenase